MIALLEITMSALIYYFRVESIGLEINFSKFELYFLDKPKSDNIIKMNSVDPGLKSKFFLTVSPLADDAPISC